MLWTQISKEIWLRRDWKCRKLCNLVVGMKLLRWMSEHTRRDKIRNKDIRGKESRTRCRKRD